MKFFVLTKPKLILLIVDAGREAGPSGRGSVLQQTPPSILRDSFMTKAYRCSGRVHGLSARFAVGGPGFNSLAETY